MNRSPFLASLVSLAALSGCANGTLDHVTFTETGTYSDDGTAGRMTPGGCPAYDETDGRAFVVGSSIDVDYGRSLRCLEMSGSLYERHCVRYEEAPASVELTSDHPEVLSGADGHWTFVAPGEASLVLRIDGEETVRRRFRAEALANVELRVVAQPAVPGWYVNGRDIDADVRTVGDLAIVRGGAGTRVILRPLSASGEALCGRLPVRTNSTDVTIGVAPGYEGAEPALNGVLALRAGASAARDTELPIAIGGASATLVLGVVEPSEITALRVHDQRLGGDAAPLHVIDATTFVGDREVFGASLTVATTGTYDCTDASVFGPGDVDAPGDTRFVAESYCGAETPATIHLSIEGATLAPVPVALP